MEVNMVSEADKKLSQNEPHALSELLLRERRAGILARVLQTLCLGHQTSARLLWCLGERVQLGLVLPLVGGEQRGQRAAARLEVGELALARLARSLLIGAARKTGGRFDLPACWQKKKFELKRAERSTKSERGG
jgi:hypothetical protein